MTGYDIFKNNKAASILGGVYIDVKENMQVYLRHELMFENIEEIRVEIQKRVTKYVLPCLPLMNIMKNSLTCW